MTSDLQDWMREGLSQARAGQFEAAAHSFGQAIECDPGHAPAHHLLGAVLINLGQSEDALEKIDHALTIDASSPDALHNRGFALANLGRTDEAVVSFRQALALRPVFPEAWNNLGNALSAKGAFPKAIAAYREALRLQPAFVLAMNGLGNALHASGDTAAAIGWFEEALSVDPNYPDAAYNLGRTLRASGRLDEAIEQLRRAIDRRPRFVDALMTLGVCYADRRDPEQAIHAFRAALEVEPANALVRSQLLFQLARQCDWDAIDALDIDWDALGVTDGPIPPFTMLALDDDPIAHRRRSEVFVRSTYPRVERSFARPMDRPERLRVGYFSSDFYDHATSYLAAGLFESHDRDRFEVIGYSLGPAIKDAMAARVRAGCDCFVELGAVGDREATDLVLGDELDIAIDLKGYTEGNRLGIFAQRIAPLQMTFLGYPGTSGAPFMDYLIADRTVIDADNRDGFSESVLTLPECYQPNDRTRPEGGSCTRADAGLPAQSFVFCCFNNSYKITRDDFRSWMALLKAVDGSVLWLLITSLDVRRRLRDQAAAHGVDPDRLVFADHRPLADHLARQRHADLFLDTFIYNAHTTASDALWAGVPVLTVAGKGFAGRVAASILATAGLPELIADDRADYLAKATRLARDEAK